jgi:pSer/pThr/pTyr-binding forkhead associated (FHA) protein
MLRLVILSPGMTGRSQEVTAEKVTLGRLEDNTFQIAEASVSSHHCEVELRGSDVVVRDLNSTNGTFIGGDKVTEKVLSIGQILRLGQVELRLEADAAGAPPKKHFDRTTILTGGVKPGELDHTRGTGGFDTKSAGFSKKTNKVNQIFIVIGAVLGLVIVVLLLYIAATIKK